MVGSVMKYFRMSYKEVTEERSYLNIALLNASIPRYVSEKKRKGRSVANANEFFRNFVKHR